MARLLDVNVLIALCDPGHIHHESAWHWFKPLAAQGWATCPLTENALLRILSQSSYPQSLGSPDRVLPLLNRLGQFEGHQFWNDDVSFTMTALFQSLENTVSTQLTDLYLLGLAVRHEGKFSTFDEGVRAGLISGGADALEIVPSK